jgi:hypothetical protein
MIEPLRPEIESARMEATPGRAKEAPPQNRDGERINFPIRPANRAFPEDETTRAADGETTLKEAPLTGTDALGGPLHRGVAGQTKGRQSAVTTMRSETARVPVFTDLAKIPAVRPPLVPNRKAPGNQGVMDTIPKPLCWALLASSIAILLIEIWNYIR